MDTQFASRREALNSVFILWMTGLSGSGKTTLAQAVRNELVNMGIKVHHLDGDEIRAAAPVKLGFSSSDRDRNILTAIELAERYQRDGFSVIASFISPYRRHRDWARERLVNCREVFVNLPLEVCEARDVKGLYRKARAGEIEFFTGISDAYERPDNPHLEVKTNEVSVFEAADKVVSYLSESGLI